MESKKLPVGTLQHGDARGKCAREYNIWCNMKTRCLCPTHSSYHHYGARGISVCERWMTYQNFLADMGRAPSPRHSIDRIDNDGNYEPANCRWATQKEQNCNQARNTKLTHLGRTMTINEWAKELGISCRTLRARVMRYGWSPERALTVPPIVDVAARFKAKKLIADVEDHEK